MKIDTQSNSRTNFDRSLAVVIGINDYSNGIHTLKTAKADAEELARILEEKYGYKVILVTDNTNIKPTRDNLLKLLKKTLASENLTEGDRLLFYFAGHGIARPDEEEGEEGPQGFLVPSDAHYDKPNSLISMKDVYEYLAKLECRHLLVILDCCFAGAFRWAGTRAFIYTPKKVTEAHYQRFTNFRAWEVITSSAYNQEALDFLNNRGEDEANNEKHSPFAQGLFEGLDGKADLNNDGVIIAPELYLSIRDYVENYSNNKQTPGFFPLQKHDRGEYIFRIPGQDLNLDPAPELNLENNPYRGLESFEQQNARFFFGRQELIEKLFTVVSQSQYRLTTVVGISGSGKSSLVKAGLIPCLNDDKKTKWQLLGIIRDDNKEIIDPIRPETNPYDSLAKAFRVIETKYKINSDDLKKWCEAKTKTVNPLSKLIKEWSKNNNNIKLLLIIDQFEELITLASKISPGSEEKELNWWDKIKSWLNKTPTHSPSKISLSQEEALQQQWLPFIELLANTIEECPQFNLVITLRSDFAPRFANSGFKSYWEASQFTVRSMRPDELREVVINPATERALYFEPANLVDTIVDEVYQMPGALPLLSFALSELYFNLYKRWDSGETKNRALSLDDYQKLGGVTGSLTRRVDEEYESLLDDAHRLTMRRIMLRMVEIDGVETVRRRVFLSELEYSSEKENKQVKEIRKRLVDARLIVEGDKTGKAYVEPAHDFLVRGWNRLQNWITSEKENLVLQQLLTPASQTWKNQVENWKNKIEKAQNPSRFLWDTNPRLDQLEKILKESDNWFNETERDFVQRSINLKKFKQRRTIVITTVVFLIISGAGIWAEYQRRLANDRERNNKSLQLATASEASLNVDTTRSLLLAIQANLIKETPQSAYALWQAFQENHERFQLVGHKGKVTYAEFDHTNSNRILTISNDKTARIWNLNHLHNFITLKGHQNTILHGTFAKQNSNRVLTVSSDGTANIWDLSKPDKPLIILRGHKGAINYGTFAPTNDNRVLTVSSDRTARLWDISIPTAPKVVRVFKGHNAGIFHGSFDLANANRILTVSGDSTARIWDLNQSETPLILKGHTGAVVYGTFDPKNSNQVLTVSDDKTARLWDLNVPNSSTVLEGHHKAVLHGIFYPKNSNRVLTVSNDKTIRIWDTNNPKNPKILTGHQDSIYYINFNPKNPNQFLTVSSDKTSKIWDINSSNPLMTFYGHKGKVVFGTFHPHKENRILTTSDDKTARIWDIREKVYQELSGRKGKIHRGIVSGIFNPENPNQVITVARDGTIKYWNINNPKKSKILPKRLGSTDDAQIDSKNPTRIATVNPKGFGIINIDKNNRLPIRTAGKVESVTFDLKNPNRVLIVSGSTATVWDINNNIRTNLSAPRLPMNQGEFDPNDSNRLATGGADGILRIWNLKNPTKPQKELTVSRKEIWHVSFDPKNSNRILILGSDRLAKILNILTGEETNLTGHTDTVVYGSFDPNNSNRVLTVSHDGTARIWNTKNPGNPLILKGSKQRLIYGIFDPKNSNRVLTVSSNGNAIIHIIGGRNLSESAWNRASRCFSHQEVSDYNLAELEPLTTLSTYLQKSAEILSNQKFRPYC